MLPAVNDITTPQIPIKITAPVAQKVKSNLSSSFAITIDEIPYNESKIPPSTPDNKNDPEFK